MNGVVFQNHGSVKGEEKKQYGWQHIHPMHVRVDVEKISTRRIIWNGIFVSYK